MIQPKQSNVFIGQILQTNLKPIYGRVRLQKIMINPLNHLLIVKHKPKQNHKTKMIKSQIKIIKNKNQKSNKNQNKKSS